ncbi:MAG: hypothetical protein HDQ95_10125 [Roseburia sp.]|nr:hypothetical protein [Roseburia sp.]
MRKNNELKRLYDEVKNEIKGKQELPEIVCYKEKLEEIIGDNKDIYLRYKILSQGNSSSDIITLIVTLIALVINTLMTAVGLVSTRSIIPDSLAVIYIVLLSGYVIWLLCYMFLKMRWLPLYRNVSIILDEIYIEKFEK